MAHIPALPQKIVYINFQRKTMMDHPEEFPSFPQAEPDKNEIEYQLQSLAHPFAEVRAEAIATQQALPTPTVMQRMVELLQDSSQIVRHAAAHALWTWAGHPHPVTNSLAFALRHLRDAIQGDTLFPLPFNNQEAWDSFYQLRNTRPDQYPLFKFWCLYTWCRSDDTLTQYSQELSHLHQRFGTFYGHPSDIVRHIGIKLALIGGVEAVETVREAIRVTEGHAAAHELDDLWNNNCQNDTHQPPSPHPDEPDTPWPSSPTPIPFISPGRPITKPQNPNPIQLRPRSAAAVA